MLRGGRREYTVQEIVDAMRAAGIAYAELTIQTHVTSRPCANSVVNHGVVYDDSERLGYWLYRLAN